MMLAFIASANALMELKSLAPRGSAARLNMALLHYLTGVLVLLPAWPSMLFRLLGNGNRSVYGVNALSVNPRFSISRAFLMEAIMSAREPNYPACASSNTRPILKISEFNHLLAHRYPKSGIARAVVIQSAHCRRSSPIIQGARCVRLREFAVKCACDLVDAGTGLGTELSRRLTNT